jgi:predicted O-linked N-acetylglucosamine transferase (SPINDLY family)
MRIDLQGLLADAQRWVMSGQHPLAVAMLQPVVEDPTYRADALYLLAVSALGVGGLDEALAHAHAAVAARPDDARCHFVLGRALKAGEDRVGAEAAYRRAIALQPRFAEAMVSLGIVRKDMDDLDEAIDLYEKALRIQPSLAAAHANRAHALALRAERMAKDGFDEEPHPDMLDAQGRAVALDLKNPRLHKNYGVLLLQARRHPEAVAAFNEALTLDPTDVECCMRLGDALQDIGASELEIECYRTWLARNPQPNAPVMRALAGVLNRVGEADEGLQWAERSMALERDPVTLLQIANLLQQLRRVDEALLRGREAIDAAGRMHYLYPNYLLGANYVVDDPKALFDLHAEFGASLPPPQAPRPQRRARAAGERLRIGYVSGDFLRHSVAYFADSLFATHDRERFEVVCYQNNAHVDDVTERLKGHGHRWVECAGLSDNALRSRIVNDGIDVLVDLSGHTGHSRALMMVTPCAPVQVAYLGYPTVTGVPSMDFRITDHVIDPGDMPAIASERPLHMPDSMFCFSPDPASPPIAPTPARERGVVTFGSFNNIAKVTDRTLALWAEVMKAVPGSRLLLKAGAMGQASNRAGIERFMGERGIAAERLSLLARTPTSDSHLALYNQVDIALDTLPYTGATTTCEALWMGVPVLTVKGRTHTSRMSASILCAAGRPDWVIDGEAAYVATAAAMAADLDGLDAWRLAARDRLRASALTDRVRFTRAFEALLERAWHRQGADAPSATPA